MKSLRIAISLVVLAAMLAALAGCGPTPTPTPVPTQVPPTPTKAPVPPTATPVPPSPTPAPTATPVPKVKITLWTWRVEDKERYKVFLAEFNKDFPNIDVDVTFYTSDAYKGALTAAMSVGEGPDIPAMYPDVLLQPYADTGQLEDLTNIIEVSQFFPSAIKDVSSWKDGKVYAVPLNISVYAPYYNKKILNSLNIQVPNTYKEFLAACEKIKAAGIDPIAGGNADFGFYFLWMALRDSTFGGKPWLDGFLSGKNKLTDPPFVRTLERLVELKPYYMKGWEGTNMQQAWTHFAQGKAAFYTFAEAAVPILMDLGMKAEDIGVFLFPGDEPDSGWVEGGTGVTFALNKASKHKKEATEFIKWIASAKGQQVYNNALQNLPVRKDVKAPAAPLVPETVALFRNGERLIPLTHTNALFAPGSAVIGADFQSIFTGKVDPKDLAARAQAAIDKSPK